VTTWTLQFVCVGALFGEPGLFEQSVGAAEEAADEESSSENASPSSSESGFSKTIKGWKFDLSGYVRGDAYVGKTEGAPAPEMKAGYGEASLKLRAGKSKFGDGFAELRMRTGYENQEMGAKFDLREAYVNGYFGPVDIRLGHQIIVWGRADGINPTNVLTPVDMRIRSPIEDDRRLANFGLRTFLNFSPVRIEGVWLPFFQPSYWPRFELEDDVVLGQPRFPKPKLIHGLGAGRLHLEFSKFEMSASYVNGFAPLPGLIYGGSKLIERIDEDHEKQNSIEIDIVQKAYRHQVAGFDFSTAVGSLFGLRGEVAYRRPFAYQERLEAPNPDLQYVLGIDREFGPVSVIAQYVGRYVFDWEEEREPDERPDYPFHPNELLPPLGDGFIDKLGEAIEPLLRARNQIIQSQIRPIQHSVSLRAEWFTLHDTLSLSALGLFNISTFEWVAYPKLSYRINDGMLLSAGAELYFGPDGTLIGLIDETLTAGYVELRYSF